VGGPVDVLSDVLRTARPQSAVMGRLDLRAPWALRMRARPFSVFHVVLDGTCVLTSDGAAPRTARKGDVMLLPRGGGHELRDTVDSPAEAAEVDGRSAPVVRSGDGPPAVVVCGLFRFEDRHSNLLLGSLPELVHVHDLGDGAGPWLAQTLALIDHETRTLGPGADAALSGLCDTLFTYVLRSHLQDARDGWLGALRDAHVGEALRLIHESPGHPWTVPELATRVAMSRSAFAQRFTELVGTSPLAYVVAWRMQKAAGLLRATRQTLGEIAGAVGYESEPAFSKAFKREQGVTPGAYRSGVRPAPGGSDKSLGGPDIEAAAGRS
jgi:AraC-like DNA-binding protein